MRRITTVSVLVLAVAGCGGGSSGGDDILNDLDFTSSVSGYAADGYLANATVCLDTNKDLSCTGEASSTTTDSAGQFTLEAEVADFSKYEVLVEAIAGVTIDLDKPGVTLSKGFTLRAPAGLKDDQQKIPVTPITTVLAAEKSASPGKSNQDVINDSGMASQLCPLSDTAAAKKSCITDNYIEKSTSSDPTTKLLAGRKQLVARVMAGMLADAGQKAGDQNGKQATGNALAAQSNKVVSQVDNAIGQSGGDTSGVDTGKLAKNNSIVGGEGANALINASEVPTEATTVTEAFKASAYKFTLAGNAITGDRMEPGRFACYLFCQEADHILTSSFPISDWGNHTAQEQGELVVEGNDTVLFKRGLLTDTSLARYNSEASKLSLTNRSIGQLMDAFAPAEDRKWRHVVNQCAVFEAGAEGYLIAEPSHFQVNNPAYGFYSIIPDSVMPAGSESSFYDQHDIAQIISNYTSTIGTFSVIVGPDVYVALADGTAEFFKTSTATSLGKTEYVIREMKTLLGTARAAIIPDLKVVGSESLYIDKTKEQLGIAVTTDPWIKSYSPKQTFGTDSETGRGVGVFGTNPPKVPRLYLNTAAAKQLAAAIDASALANPSGDMDSTVNCNYTVKAGTDSDGDGVDDGEDAFPNDASESGDIDGDGTGDNADTDRDGDGIKNDSDAFPNDPTESKDSDGDGVGDNSDSDRDGDGIVNDDDAFPDDPDESGDLDSDGIGDNSDPDRDGDGVNNDEDSAPDDPNIGGDMDGDGIDDALDADRDGDGVNNNEDAFPNDPAEWSDLDGDGTGDNSDVDRDGDSVWNDQDPFPDDPNEFSDIDGDGIGDNSDPDRDGDGVNNDLDAFPNDPTETVDTDGDGIGDNSDPTPNGTGGATDSDNDGVPDDQDAFPDDPAEWADSDGDGFGDNYDPEPNDPLIPGEDYCDPVLDPLCEFGPF